MMTSKLEEYSAGYNRLLRWISSRQEPLASPEFPTTVEETRRLLDNFRQQRTEDKEEEKKKKELGAMEKELAEFQQKYNKEFDYPQFAKLEMVRKAHSLTTCMLYNFYFFTRNGPSTKPQVTAMRVSLKSISNN